MTGFIFSRSLKIYCQINIKAEIGEDGGHGNRSLFILTQNYELLGSACTF